MPCHTWLLNEKDDPEKVWGIEKGLDKNLFIFKALPDPEAPKKD